MSNRKARFSVASRFASAFEPGKNCAKAFREATLKRPLRATAAFSPRLKPGAKKSLLKQAEKETRLHLVKQETCQKEEKKEVRRKQAGRKARPRRGFTFVEVLAAMLFMAILIPAAVEGLMVANRAGVVAERKRVAAQIADRLLSETMATEEWREGDREEDCGEDWPGYRWRLTSDSWEENTMRTVTVTVFFTVQGREYQVALTTLAEDETATASEQTTETGRQ